MRISGKESPMDQRPILIVDDDGILRDMCAEALLYAGYQVIVATEGAEALTYTHRFQPALVLMDIRMPVLDGLSACQHLKANPVTANIPILLVSAHAQFTDPRVTACADGVLAKPFDIETLLTRVQELVVPAK